MTTLNNNRGLRFAAVACVALACACSAFAEGAAIPSDAMVRIDAQTKAVLRGSLKYLASKQHLDGSWTVKEGNGGYPVAMTGYTLLAFMATGNLPDEGEYSRNVAAGMQYLLDSIQEDGLFRNVSDGQYMYNHGIATIALAELCGQSKSKMIRSKLQKAVGLILKAQNNQGGWRYNPVPNDADISVTAMQAVALRAAQEAGLAVPQEAIDKAISYINSCYVPDKAHPDQGAFSYQPGNPPGFARTAAAIYSLQVLGKYDDPKVKLGSNYLFANLNNHEWWTYGNYYAAPAQYMIGGETWRNWYAQVRQILMSFVVRQGDLAYWDTTLSGDNGVGPVFTTAVYVHILAMPYHFVPLYQR